MGSTLYAEHCNAVTLEALYSDAQKAPDQPVVAAHLVPQPPPTRTESVRDEARWWLNTAEGDLGAGLGGDPTRYYDETIGRECLEHAETILRFARAELRA